MNLSFMYYSEQVVLNIIWNMCSFRLTEINSYTYIEYKCIMVKFLRLKKNCIWKIMSLNNIKYTKFDYTKIIFIMTCLK